MTQNTDAQPPAEPNEARQPRGFALYVGIDEAKASANGIDLPRLVEALKTLAGELAPDAETYAAVALAPESAGGRDVDVVRLALQEPAAVARVRGEKAKKAPAVVVDFSRKRVLIDGNQAPLTFKEFELLKYLIEHRGRTVSREELLEEIWGVDEELGVTTRTVDTHVSNLRSKLGAGFAQPFIVAVHKVGYKFVEP